MSFRTLDHHAKALRRTKYSVIKVRFNTLVRMDVDNALTEDEADKEESSVIRAVCWRYCGQGIEYHRPMDSLEDSLGIFSTQPPKWQW